MVGTLHKIFEARIVKKLGGDVVVAFQEFVREEDGTALVVH